MAQSSGKLDRWRDKIIRELETLGLQVQEVRRQCHVVVKGTLNGHPFNWTTSSTPSDRRAQKGMLRDLKRQLKRCGIEKPPTFGVGYLTAFPPPVSSQDFEAIWTAIQAWETEIDESGLG